MTDPSFQRYSAYYDLLYRDKDYEAETRYVVRVLRDASPGIRTVLELGSGTGRHGRMMAAEGFHVFGIERSEMMAAAAKQAIADAPSAGSFDCSVGDARTIDLNRTFEAVISLFHVISYHVSNQDILQTFANAHRHLQPGGFFFFDLWHGPAVLHDPPAVRVKRMEDETLRVTRISEPVLDTNASTVAVNYTIWAEAKPDASLTTFCETHLMRYFFPVEIALIAAQTGFKLVMTEEFLTRRHPSEKTWGVAYLLQRTP